MPRPGILIGGNTTLLRSNPVPESSTGVFANHPGSTPKYALSAGIRDAEYRDTMARLFVEIPHGQMEDFLAQVPEETRDLAKVLADTKSSGGSSGTGFIDFLLTAAQESFREKAQIVDTLTDNYVAFYAGQEPPVFSYGGTLLNTYQDDQRVWMLRLYRDILRGTRLANRNLIVRLRYDSFIVGGYLESLDLSLTGEMVNHSNFRFNLRVKELEIVTPALSRPTVVATDVSNFALSDPQDPDIGDRNRAATLTTEDPPTALTGPAASNNDHLDERLEPGDEIEQFHTVNVTEPFVFTATVLQVTAPALLVTADAPQAEMLASTRGAENLGAAQLTQVAGKNTISAANQLVADAAKKEVREAARASTSNTSFDGLGGLSNIRGQLEEDVRRAGDVRSVQRVKNRSRGERTVPKSSSSEFVVQQAGGRTITTITQSTLGVSLADIDRRAQSLLEENPEMSDQYAEAIAKAQLIRELNAGT